MERSFALDVGELLASGREAGTRGILNLNARYIAWPLKGLFLIRRTDMLIMSAWFDHRGVGFVELLVDVPPPGSHRRPYLVCPSQRHAVAEVMLAARLYWPVGDPTGFACRECHRLAYQRQQTRREESLWLRRLKLAAGVAAGP